MMNEIAAEEIRRQLHLILASDGFRDAGRLGPFLTFLVDRVLAGEAAGLKESVVGVEVFRRPADYDPRTDPIVRVEARRLRARLEQYYQEHHDPVVISVPKGGYVPGFARSTVPRMRRLPLAVALVALTGLAIVVGFFRWQASTPQSPQATPVIAVLPIRNLSLDPDSTYFSDGLTIDLIDALSKVENLRVIGWNAVQRFRGRAESLGELRDQLAASAVLDGAVRRQDKTLRVTAHLTNTSTGHTIWSETYEREAHDVFRIQEEIARAIVRGLRVRLDPASPGVHPPAQTENLEAYNHYLRARYHRNQFSDEGIHLSSQYAQRAIDADPRFAPAYALLAGNYTLAGYYRAMPSAAAFARAEQLARRAITIDPDSGEARAALGCALAIGRLQWPEAGRELSAAIRLAPGSADTHGYYAICYLLPTGALEQAEAEIRKSLDLDPLTFFSNFVAGYILLQLGKLDEAVRQYDRVIEIYHAFDDLHWDRGMTLAFAGRMPEARAAFAQAAKVRGQTAWTPSATELALLGEHADAGAVLTSRQPALERARAWAMLGDRDQAFQALDEAFRERDPQVVFARVDRRLENLRPDPRFARFVQRLNLPPMNH
jgi:serine/threonine-protein kinase